MAARTGRPTIRDIAAATGLSTATVSYALRGLHVPQATQERVRAAADALGYHGNAAAAALRSGRSGMVGVLAGALADSWQVVVASALVAALPEHGLRPILVDAASDPAHEADLVQQLLHQGADAIVATPVDPAGEHWAAVPATTALIAIGDALTRAPGAAAVAYDNRFGVGDALGQLAHAGHREVLVLRPGGRTTPERSAESLVAAIAPQLGLRVEIGDCPLDLPGATRTAQAALRAHPRPTAVFALADAIAWGVYGACRELGLAIPGDVSVVGYDAAPVSSLLTPPLASYSWPIDALVDTVTRWLDERIGDAGPAAADEDARRAVISPSCVNGGSIGAPCER